MNSCKTCKNWVPIPLMRTGSRKRVQTVAHSGKCPALLKILVTPVATYIETPAAFSCKYWATK